MNQLIEAKIAECHECFERSCSFFILWCMLYPYVMLVFLLLSSYNLGHNILKLYDVLVQTQLTTSKTKLDMYYSKLGIRVASRVPERLKA